MASPCSAPTPSVPPPEPAELNKPARPPLSSPVNSATFIQVSIAQPPAPLESESPPPVHDDDEHDDPGYESAESSAATESIVSSIRDYVYENGRRYHRYSEGSYNLPNDETEMERLELVHHQNLLLLRGSLCITPIDDEVPIKVLDCGTGTGIWALDFGEVHPKADVVGVDLSPIQPAWVFPNVRFEVDDIEKVWTYPENHFDFIFSRHLGQSIKDWKRYLEQMFHHCAPDGRVELIEHSMYLHPEDSTFNEDSNLFKYTKKYEEAVAAAGMRCVLPPDIQQAAEEAGFVDIEVHTVKIPWGAWPKDPEMKNVGRTTAAVLSTGGFEAYALQLMTRYLGTPADEVIKMSKAALKDVLSRRVHSYQEQWYIIARKPHPDELAFEGDEVDIQVEIINQEDPK